MSNGELSINNDQVKGSKGYRSIGEVESFYRFIHENGLRREAKMIISAILDLQRMANKKKSKSKKTKKVQ